MFKRPRVIPVLLLSGEGLVKTVRFENPAYIGDPINAMKIFNDSEVDELILLDITRGRSGLEPNFEKLEEIVTEAFMPICYGGAIRSLPVPKRLFSLGVEKLSFNLAAFDQPELIEQVAKIFGSQSVVVSIDVRKNIFGKYSVSVDGGKKNTKISPVEYAKKMESLGAGEILLNSVDRDGTRSGFDLEMISSVTRAVNIPVIACGGANDLKDFQSAINTAGASAVAAGSMFVFHGRLRGVLINYPTQSALRDVFLANK